MAAFPLAPRFAKMLALGDQKNILSYVITIVAALSVRDPLLRMSSVKIDKSNEEEEEDDDDEEHGEGKEEEEGNDSGRKRKRKDGKVRVSKKDNKDSEDEDEDVEMADTIDKEEKKRKRRERGQKFRLIHNAHKPWLHPKSDILTILFAVGEFVECSEHNCDQIIYSLSI